MGHRLFLFILILLTSVVSQAETKKAGWGYKAFPIVKPEGRDLLPLRVSIGRQVLRARLRPGAGTHRQLGIEQLYTDRFYKKRIHVKKQVQVTGDKVIGGWRQVAKGYVLHLSHQGSTTAFYATGLDARERFFFESQVRKLYPVARVWNPFLPAAFAETTSGGGRVSTTDVTQAQVPWVLSSLSVAAGATTCYLARGGENFMEMAQGAAEGVRGVIDDPGGAWQSAKNWVSETADSAVTGVANAWENRREIAAAVGEKVERGYEAVANGANYVVDGVMDGTIWEDIGNATTQTLEYLQRLGTLAVEQIQGFAQLPDYAKAQILCEMAIQMTGEGIATLVMAATGAGAALAIPRVAAFFARFGQMMVQAFPEIQYIISLGESLSENEKIRRIREILRGESRDGRRAGVAVAADRPAIVSADGPSGGSAGIAPIPRNPQAAERLGLTEAEYEARLARNMADMPENERLNLAAQAVGRPLTEAQNRAVLLAHETGVLGPEGTFSRADLLAKARILREAGFSREEIQALMDNGITGRRMLAGSGNATLSVTEAERLLTQAGLSPDQITRFRQNLGYRRDNLSGAEITEVWSTINGKGVAALKSGRTAEASRHFAQGEEALNALLQRNLAEGRDTSPIIARLFAHRDLGAVSGGRIPDGDQLFDQAVRAGYFDSRFSGDRSLQDFYDPRARGNPDRYSALAVGRGQDPYLVYAAANRQYQELLAIRAYLIQPAYQRTVDMPAWLQGVNERQLSEWMQDYRRSMEQIQREHFRGS